MTRDMYHHNQIARALRMLVQGAAALRADSDETDLVEIEPSPLFEAGVTVRLVDDQGQVEEHIIAERVSALQVRLESSVAGRFTVADSARLQLRDGIGAQLKWVSQGRPELMPRPQCLQLPAVVVEPVTMRQPGNAGSNRTYQQEYLLNVYYLRQAVEGEQANVELLDDVAELFNRIMSDPYLGETCWHAQVTEVETRPAAEERLRAVTPGVQVVKLEVAAMRSEVW